MSEKSSLADAIRKGYEESDEEFHPTLQVPENLNYREQAAARMLASGKDITDIATELDIHYETARKYAAKPEVKALTQRLIDAKYAPSIGDKLSDLAMTGVEVIGDLLASPSVKESTKADLAKYVVNHYMGTPTQKHDISGGVTVKDLLRAFKEEPDVIDIEPQEGEEQSEEQESNALKALAQRISEDK